MVCKICKKETNMFVAKIILAHNEPPRRVGIDLRYKTNAAICPECGGIFILGAESEYLKMLSTDFEPVEEDEIKKIDIETILNEIEPQKIDSREIMIWVKRDIILSTLDDLSEGITFDHSNYYKLIRFLLLPQKERIKIFGKVKSPTCMFVSNGLDSTGKDKGGLSFIDGRRRFSLFHYYFNLDWFPVSVLPKDIKELNFLNLEYKRDRYDKL